jgi:hypothetical protein
LPLIGSVKESDKLEALRVPRAAHVESSLISKEYNAIALAR